MWKIAQPSLNLGSANLTCNTKEEKLFCGVLRDAPWRGLAKKALRKGSKNCNHLAKEPRMNMIMTAKFTQHCHTGISSMGHVVSELREIRLSLHSRTSPYFLWTCWQLQWPAFIWTVRWRSSQTLRIGRRGQHWGKAGTAMSWGQKGPGAHCWAQEELGLEQILPFWLQTGFLCLRRGSRRKTGKWLEHEPAFSFPFWSVDSLHSILKK